MKRRPLLAALAASPSMAGCLDRVASRESASATPTDAIDTPTCPSDDRRRVSLVETAELPSDLNLSMTATIQREKSGPDATARVEVQLTNTGERRVIFPTESSNCHPFNRRKGQSDPTGLWLHTPGWPEERVGSCWTRPEVGERAFEMHGCGGSTFDAGGARTWTYDVWDDYRVDGYYPTGRFRFATRVEVTPPGDDSAERKHDWWLDLRVTRPDS